MVEVAVEDVKPSRKKLHIKVEPERIKEKKDEIVNDLRKTVKIKGFRKGKVPKEIILRSYKQDIEDNIKRELMAESYEFAIEDNKIDAVSDPVFTEVVYDEDKGLSFTAMVDVKPQFELKEYKGIEITAKPIEITEESINDVLNQLREAFATLEDKDGDTFEEGDIGIIDLKTFTQKTNYPINEFGGENLPVELGKKQLIEEIESQLKGMKVGETKKIEASFDKDYPLRALKGKDVVFEVTLKSLKQKKLPEIDDEFAKKINKEFKNVDDLKEDIRNKLKENKEREEIERQKDELLKKLLDEYDFDLPESLVNQEANQMIMEYVKEMYYRGADVSSEEFKPQKLRERFEPEAKKRVKSTFILLEIAKKERLDVSNEEINQVIAQDANARRMNFEDVYKEYQEKGVLPVIQMEILGDKALDLLHKNAKIIEENQEAQKEAKENETKEDKE
ncbi:trigger factor [Hippea maritima]|uniref:Trigger factor n=1 Tax=Hippea maritima (strain ATCC 700847 / DSM 10411 / MH2) TaxID=760142 RepID=F2LU32_HIPMA|nr:trigger factor [Hippea maritima]AEA33431.1 Trigger factor [Hippea maritima DSM 10411]